MFALRLLMACSWASHGPLMGCSRRVTHFSLLFALREGTFARKNKEKWISFGSLLAYSYLCSQINHLTLTRYEENHYIFIQTGGGDAACDDAHGRTDPHDQLYNRYVKNVFANRTHI